MFGSMRLIIILGAALTGSACILQTASPAAQIVVVTTTQEAGAPGSSTQTPDAQALPSLTLELTQILTATLTPTNTIAQVTMTAGQALSCVKGPDWKLYEWVAGIAEGETVTLVARAVPEIPDYFVARTGGGQECWVFGGSSTISGPTSSLPVRETPPLPQVTFVIDNKVQIPLCVVYIRGKDETVWGANRLSAPILVSASFGITLTAGYYDVQIMDCAPTVLYEGHDRAIGPDPTYSYQLIAIDVDFYIQNNLPYSICRIQTRTAALPAWQDLYNHDSGGSFAVGTRKNFTLRAGFYDVRITRCTDAVLPLTILYVRPGVGGFTWA
ncbi:MAG: hypothetical protein JW748_13325 [Anaerolineales bacterium]|nr:hypothetical protein [Anaerolineales bacterium]